MSTIRCYDSDGSVIEELYQWNCNVKIKIRGIDLTDVVSLHFCNRNSKSAIVVTGEKSNGMIAANIPNVLLQEPETIIIFICKKLLSGEFTTYGVCRIPVHPRPKPNDYEYKENIDYVSWGDAQERINQLLTQLENGGSGSSSGSTGGSSGEFPDISGGDISGVVLFDTVQDLNRTYRTTAKNNIGVYVTPAEPTDAKEGDIWVDTDDNDESDVVPTVPDETEQVLAYVTPNWDIHNMSIPGYVHGRPMWAIEGRETITWDGGPTGTTAMFPSDNSEIHLISSSVPVGSDLVGATVRYLRGGVVYESTIKCYCKSDSDFYTVLDAVNSGELDGNEVIVINGFLMGFPVGCSVLTTSNGQEFVAVIFNKYYTGATMSGVYAGLGESWVTLSELSYDYSNIVIDSRYADIFKAPTASNVYVVDATSITSLEGISAVDFSGYSAGDVILLTNMNT